MARRGAAKEAANDTMRAELKTVVDNRTVGEILSEARIARDMDYADVASQLRIRRTYIEAIEDGRLGDLPGSTYAIGFVRTYAELLELDVPKIVTKFKQEAADFEDRTQLVFPEPMPGSRGPTASVIFIAILMLAGAYGGWLYVSNKDRETIELVPPLPEALTQLLSRSTIEEPAPEPAAQSTSTTPAQPVTAPQTQSSEASAPAAPAETPTIVNETITAVPATVQEDAAEAAVQVEPAAETAAQATETAVEATQPTSQPEATQSPEETQSAATQSSAVQNTVENTATPEPVAPAVTEQAESTVAAVSEAAESVQAPATQTGATQTEASPVQSTPVQSTPVQSTQAEAIQAETTQPETVPPAVTQQAAVPAADNELPTVGGSSPSSFGTAPGNSRIVIKATSPSWVEITAADGEVLLNRLLRVGDTFNVPDQPGIKLVTGSAGGLEFTVDGETAPKIGRIGDVRRDVLLEPDALLAGQ